jgi:hypothetical protein
MREERGERREERGERREERIMRQENRRGRWRKRDEEGERSVSSKVGERILRQKRLVVSGLFTQLKQTGVIGTVEEHPSNSFAQKGSVSPIRLPHPRPSTARRVRRHLHTSVCVSTRQHTSVSIHHTETGGTLSINQPPSKSHVPETCTIAL